MTFVDLYIESLREGYSVALRGQGMYFTYVARENLLPSIKKRLDSFPEVKKVLLMTSEAKQLASKLIGSCGDLEFIALGKTQ